ncbi:hypothetical protein MASR2M47_30460 [Draconibacterium sp.]|jgi:hypothetical protein
MKNLFLVLAVFLISNVVSSQTKSYKRGVSYGYHSMPDMQKASANISWWYNWATLPDAAIRNRYKEFNVDFTPMAWNASAINGVSAWADKDSTIKYVLGFNEPNFKEQANMTPTQSAKAWPALQKIAQKHNLKIVGPAVNYCGDCVSEGGTTYTNPFTYLDDFFKACDTCQVDFIGLHWYGSGNSIVGYVNTARKYKKPIWVTEFASWDYNNPVPNVTEQKKYLAGTVNFLERDPDIYRYSWFIGRLKEDKSNPFPYIDLYGANGMLTELGQLYMDIPVYDAEKKFEIPGRIEVEEYFLMSGLFCEPTSDVDGFMNIGWTDNGDWAEYKISVEKSGTYSINARVAGASTGKIDVLIDNVLIKTIDTPQTGGWQNWTDVASEIDLEAGDHILRWRIRKSGFNINWIEFSNPTSVKNNFETIETNVYPNPVTNGIINIEMDRNQSGGEYLCVLSDIYGKRVLMKNVKVNRSLFQININETHKLPAGIYYLTISGENCGVNKLVVVQ